MDVKDGLTGAGEAVRHQPKPAALQPEFAGNLDGAKLKRSQKFRVVCRRFEQCREVPARNDQYMNRGLGLEVMEGDDGIVLVDFPGRDVSRPDPAEDKVLGD